MNFMALKRMIAGFEEEASQCGLDLEKVDVLVSLDVDGVIGNEDVGNRVFGNVEDWSFSHGKRYHDDPDQFILLADFEQATSGIRIVKDKED